jgi:hypothetical protein
MSVDFGGWATDNSFINALYFNELISSTAAVDFFNCYRGQLNNLDYSGLAQLLISDTVIAGKSYESLNNFLIIMQE